MVMICAVGECDRQFAVGAERNEPAVVVDLLMMDLTDRQEVVRCLSATVSPPDDVVQFRPAVAHPASGDRTRRVQPAQGAVVGPGSPTGSSRPKFSLPGASMTPRRER